MLITPLIEINIICMFHLIYSSNEITYLQVLRGALENYLFSYDILFRLR